MEEIEPTLSHALPGNSTITTKYARTVPKILTPIQHLQANQS